MYHLVYRPTRFILRQIFKPLLTVYYQPSSKFPPGPLIFAANHPSVFDPLHLIAHLPLPVATLITHDVFAIPLVGSILKLSGHIPVDISRGYLAYHHSLSVLRSGHSILIFPEGHLSHDDGSLKPLYSGAVRLAIETGAPIIPIGINARHGHMFKKTLKLNHKQITGRFFLTGDYHIKLGRPIHLSGPINTTSLSRHKTSLSNCIYQLSQDA